MIYEKINLKEYFDCLDCDCELTAFCPENSKEIDLQRIRKTVLILPGGGYAYTSDRETDPIAFEFLTKDMNAFVLRYQCAPISYPHPLIEVYAAIAYIRQNHEKYHVDSNSISVIGFSAGGNLAATSCNYCGDKYYSDLLKVESDQIKINGCILSYPVISKDLDIAHLDSFINVSNNDETLANKYSVEKHLSDDFPKTFIWHTFGDTVVNAKNSLILAQLLHEKGITYELYISPYGNHGQSLANPSVYAPKSKEDKEYYEVVSKNQFWIERAILFIKNFI